MARASILFAAFVSVVSPSFPVSACKVITFLPNKQIILKKSFVKKYFVKNQAAFRMSLRWLRFVVLIRQKHSVLYMYVRARVRVSMCVRGCINEGGEK